MSECYDRLVTHDDVKDLPDIPWHSDLSNFRWPRYQNGEYVNFGDALPQFADTIYKTVKTISFNEDGVIAIGNAGGSAKRTIVLKPGERVECKYVLAADGLPLKEGEMVFAKNGKAYIFETMSKVKGCENIALLHEANEPRIEIGLRADQLTHQRPVLDLDDVPIKKGDTVYEVDKSYPPLIVVGLPEPGAYRSVKVMCPSGAFTGFDPERLTHVKPEPPRTCEACRYWQRDPDTHNIGVCWNRYAERDGEDSYAARLRMADACKCFKERKE